MQKMKARCNRTGRCCAGMGYYESPICSDVLVLHYHPPESLEGSRFEFRNMLLVYYRMCWFQYPGFELDNRNVPNLLNSPGIASTG